MINYTIFSIFGIALLIALVPTIGASNVFATVNDNAGFDTEETTTCTNTQSGNSEDGPCPGNSANSPNIDEETCKSTTNKAGKEVKGDKFSGYTVR